MDKNKSILIFSPHHDDESLGMGGTIRLLTNNECSIFEVVVTSGYTGVLNTDNENAIKIREKESIAAGDVLGIKEISFMHLPDHMLEFCKDNMQKFISVIRKYNPDIIYLPHKDESDRDHRLVCEMGKEAAWLAQLPSIISTEQPAKQNEIRYYEVWTPMPKIKNFVGIDSVSAEKEEAIKCYASQMAQRDYLNMATGLNMFRAGKHDSSCKKVEVFS
ncbi:MAG: PIG-L family deacetylase [Patescibacteria group bacterium]